MSKVINDELRSPTITPRRRELMHRVMDGFEKELAGTMMILNGYKFCDNFLLWLIENRFTGKDLIELMQKRFWADVPALVNWMVTKMNLALENEARARIFGNEAK